MRNALQFKILLAILAVLGMIAVLLRRGGDTIAVAPADRQLQQKLAAKAQPSPHHYLVP